jgi:hypothetical protein
VARVKSIVEILFMVLASVAVLTQAARIFLGWREGRLAQKEIRKGSHVRVSKIDPRFPPGMLIEYDNDSQRTIREVRLRVVFESEGQVVASADRDYGEIKPGEKKLILLKSMALDVSPEDLSQIKSLKYRLLVYPGYRKPLPEITGEFDVASRDSSPDSGLSYLVGACPAPLSWLQLNLTSLNARIYHSPRWGKPKSPLERSFGQH